MSLEVWGDDSSDLDDGYYDRLLEAGWWDDTQVDAVKQAIKDLAAEPFYENGNVAEGVSVQFLMRLTILRDRSGLLSSDDPAAREANDFFWKEAERRRRLTEAALSDAAEPLKMLTEGTEE